MITGIGDFWIDGANYGLIGPPRISLSQHAVKRFHSRIRPDLKLGHCSAEMQKLAKNIHSMRENKRRDESWYIFVDYEKPFTIIGIPRFYVGSSNNGFVTRIWKAVTVLSGHEHY